MQSPSELEAPMQQTAIDMAATILEASASGAPYRLEYVRGRLKIEASPASRHQKTARRVERSLRPSQASENPCGCFGLQDVLIRFPDPDGSLKRPDIAIFCQEPPDTDEALTVIPGAVIEILSVGYEDKDLGADGAPFYRAHGIADVLVVDPRAGLALHYHDGQVDHITAPAHVSFACGCTVTV
jgi:Uma2 family endonuclease